VIVFGISLYYKHLENKRVLSGHPVEGGGNGAEVGRKNLDKGAESDGDFKQFLQNRFKLEDKRDIAETIWRIAEFFVILGIAILAIGVDVNNHRTVDWGFSLVVSGTIIFALTVIYNVWVSRLGLIKLASGVFSRLRKKLRGRA
jgi:uncharacterized membrane protein YsdA (DUF1294 family)